MFNIFKLKDDITDIFQQSFYCLFRLKHLYNEKSILGRPKTCLDLLLNVSTLLALITEAGRPKSKQQGQD